MAEKNQPYNRSIWDLDPRYAIALSTLSEEILKKIGLVQSVECAKKRTPPIPLQDIVKMIEIIEQLPGPDQITPERFKECLESIRCWGADIKTAICILSVLREGQYPPLDWRIAKAARKKQVIDEKEEAALNGKNKRKIAEIYVEKLLPKWIAELDEVKDPKLLDNSWGALAISN